MSLPDRFQPVPKRLLSACVLGMALIAGGCQVRPLYSDPGPVASTSANVSGSVRSKLASVSINEPGDITGRDDRRPANAKTAAPGRNQVSGFVIRQRGSGR